MVYLGDRSFRGFKPFSYPMEARALHNGDYFVPIPIILFVFVTAASCVRDRLPVLILQVNGPATEDYYHEFTQLDWLLRLIIYKGLRTFKHGETWWLLRHDRICSISAMRSGYIERMG